MSINMTTALCRDLSKAEVCFRRACEQVIILNRNVEDMTIKFNMADADGNRCMRYNIRMRMSVMEGVRNMFYEFASKKAADIVTLQRTILQVEASRSDDSDSDLSEIAYGAVGGYTSDDVNSDDSQSFC